MPFKTKQETILPASIFDFLKLVKKNNNRDWFNAHKEKYLLELNHLEKFADALLQEMNKHDVIETPTGKKSLHRIYRDTRFSKEKIPYKTNWSGSFSRAGKQRRGGYYFHIESGNSFIAGGFWAPNPEDLKRIRDEFTYDAAPLRKILKSKSFKDTFGELIGEQIKTTPKGYDANDPAIDLLRYKQFIVKRTFTNKQVLDKNFLKEANQTFKNMRSFFDYMSEVLTTDVNGISL
jgi:uncharacterized protein (TIGR02453 family)